MHALCLPRSTGNVRRSTWYRARARMRIPIRSFFKFTKSVATTVMQTALPVLWGVVVVGAGL